MRVILGNEAPLRAVLPGSDKAVLLGSNSGAEHTEVGEIIDAWAATAEPGATTGAP